MEKDKRSNKSEKNKISVIICIYGVAQYLDRCLETVVNQSYRNLEIILVVGLKDDGSDDGCLAKCRKYASRDERIKLVTCTAAGVSDARNRGLDAATGDLIGFVDGDDYIDRDMYAHLSNLLIRHKAQISVCGRYYEYRNTTLSDKPYENGPKIMNGEQALTVVMSGEGFYLHCWDKLYRAELWKNVEFPIDKYVEDRIVVDKILAKASKVVYDPTPKYHFRERMTSLSKTGNVAYNNSIANQEMAEFIYNNHPKLAALCDKYLIYEYITAIQNAYISGNVSAEELSIYRQELMKLTAASSINPYVNWKLHAKIILALNAPALLAWNTKRKNKITDKELIRFA